MRKKYSSYVTRYFSVDDFIKLVAKVDSLMEAAESHASYATIDYVDEKFDSVEHPTVDLSGYYSKEEIDTLVSEVSKTLTDYALTSYVDEKVAAIEIPSIEGLASEAYVDEKVASIEHPTVDLSNYYEKEEVDAKIAALESVIAELSAKIGALESEDEEEEEVGTDEPSIGDEEEGEEEEGDEEDQEDNDEPVEPEEEDQEDSDEPVIESTSIVLAGSDIEGVSFTNPTDLVLTTEDGMNFKVEGELNKMSIEQANVFGWGEAGAESKYLAIYIEEIGEDNPVVKSGWVDSIESEDYKDEKTGNTDPYYILAATAGEELRSELEGNSIWKVELTNGSVYTVDLTDQI